VGAIARTRESVQRTDYVRVRCDAEQEVVAGRQPKKAGEFDQIRHRIAAKTVPIAPGAFAIGRAMTVGDSHVTGGRTSTTPTCRHRGLAADQGEQTQDDERATLTTHR